MIAIMEHRIEPNIVEPNALKFIAGKIANNSGDVRQALEMLTTSIKLAHERLSSQPQDDVSSNPSSYIVKMKDVVRVNPEYKKCSEIIASLPATAVVIVSVAVELLKKEQSSASTVALKRRDLRSAALAALHRKNPNEIIDEGDVDTLLGRLDDSGIMSISEQPNNHPEEEFTCNYHPQELEMALDEALGEKDFLRSFA